MKPFLIIISLIFSVVTFGQATKNKSLLSSWDSLFMRHEQTLKIYNNYIDSLLFKSDTITTKDSIVISKFSKEAMVLQRIVKRPANVSYEEGSLECVENIREEFYSSRGLIAYVRNYRQNCLDNANRKNEEMFHAVYYERYEYDEYDNLIIQIFNLSTPMTIKETYTNENGKWTKKRQRINETDFWK